MLDEKRLKLALKEGDYKAWINGRKRFHGKDRKELKKIEYIDGICKINPLADWSFKKLMNYNEYYKLPKHPLVAKGYMSIGCEPCTSKTKDSIRDGRWAQSLKTECGIHESKKENEKFYPTS
jgi:phosphoadenosine phosphosulfate reductase